MGRRAMSEELLAVSRISPAPAAQTDYDAICAALMHTERGRWFLDEYAKRNRSADTRLLLAAIERIEAVVCAERNKQAQQGFRTDLLEMAKAITRTRAEVAEIRADDAAAPGQARDNGDNVSALPRPPRPRDVFAAAERIKDVTWAMRGHGFDPSTCDQLEELAGCILSASALRDPTDHRASKLSEVLQYLERRIDGLLESCTDGDTAEPELDSEPELMAGREPKHTNGHTNGFASPHAAEVPAPIIEPCELEAGDFDAEPASPPAPATARIEVEELEREVVALEAVEVATVAAVAVDVVEPEVVPVEAHRDGETAGLSSVLARAPAPPEAFVGPETEPSPAPAAAPAESERPSTHAEQRPPESEIPPSPPAPVISPQNHELETHTGNDTPAAPVVVAGAEPAPVDPVVADPIAAPEGPPAELTTGASLTAAPDLAAEAPAPTVEPIHSDQLLPRSPDLRTTAAAARLFLPDLEMGSDMPGRAAAWGRPAAGGRPTPPAAAPQAAATATVAPAVAAHEPATAANLQAPQADPLAGLKAMSESELIALFS
jgi:hypothetical protein